MSYDLEITRICLTFSALCAIIMPYQRGLPIGKGGVKGGSIYGQPF